MENPTGELVNQYTTDTTTNSNLTSAYGSSIKARADLSTGSAGSQFIQTSSESQNGQSLIVMYDTLSFATSNNSPTSVTMSLSLEGLLSNTSPDGYATSDTSISIYDITGYSSWLEESAYGLGMVTSFTKVATAAINFAVGDQYWLDLLNQWVSFDDMAYDTTGQTYSFDLTKSLTFEADPLKTYGIRIWTSADANGSNEGISASDFYNTSEVGFTELNGATFESGSGAFLANQGSTAPVATPEPSTILLLGAGLFGLVAVRRKRAAIQ